MPRQTPSAALCLSTAAAIRTGTLALDELLAELARRPGDLPALLDRFGFNLSLCKPSVIEEVRTVLFSLIGATERAASAKAVGVDPAAAFPLAD